MADEPNWFAMNRLDPAELAELDEQGRPQKDQSLQKSGFG